jgi:hypothetical protein
MVFSRLQRSCQPRALNWRKRRWWVTTFENSRTTQVIQLAAMIWCTELLQCGGSRDVALTHVLWIVCAEFVRWKWASFLEDFGCCGEINRRGVTL